MTSVNAWADRLGLPRHRYALRYGLTGLIRSTATGLFYPFSLLYFHRQLGASLVQIGFCLTVTGLLGAAGVTRTGPLVDRFGARNAVVTAALTRTAIFAFYPLVHHLSVFVVLGTAMTLAYRTDQVAGQAMVTTLVPPDERSTWLALSRMTLNAGIGLGALLGGLVLTTPAGYTWLVLLNAAGFAAVAAIYLTLPSTVIRTAGRKSTTRAVWGDRLFVSIALLSGVWLVVGLAVEVGLPVYLVLSLHQSARLISLVFVLNTLLVTLLQLPLAKQIRDRPVMRMFAYGLGTYATTFLILFATRHAVGAVLVGSLIAAVCTFTLGEMLVTVTGMTAITQMAPPAQVGAYVGISHLFAGVGGAAAPLIFITGLTWSPGGLWLVLALLGVLMIGVSLRLQAPVQQRIDQITADQAEPASASTSTE